MASLPHATLNCAHEECALTSMTKSTAPTREKELLDAATRGEIRPVWQMASLATITFAVCCLRLFVPPHTPLLLWGDAPGFAIKGMRMLGGELPYRDFFEFLTPGTDLFYTLLFRCFGVSLGAMHGAMALMAALAAWWLTWCASRLVRGWFVLLPAVLELGLVLVVSLDPTHHWFSTAALMGAIWVLFSGDSLGRVAAAGACCGLAASFTQTKGAAALIALCAYFVWRSMREKDRRGQWRRRSLVLCASALAIFVAINAPLIAAAGAERWAWDVIVFPVRYFGSVPDNHWTGALSQFLNADGRLKWICFPFQYFAVPLTYVWFLVRLRRAGNEHGEPWNQLVLVAAVGIAMLVAVAPALSIRRIATASPPALLLLTWLLYTSARARLAVALGAVSLAVTVVWVAALQLRPVRTLNLPIGRVAIPPRADYYDIYRWMAANTRPGQWYFGLHPLPLALKLRSATPVDQMSPGEYTRPEQVREIIDEIERAQVPVIVLRPRMYSPSDGLPDHLQPFRDDLYRHYDKIKNFASGDEIWQRRDE
jgi:hypothetical protein